MTIQGNVGAEVGLEDSFEPVSRVGLLCIEEGIDFVTWVPIFLEDAIAELRPLVDEDIGCK